MTTEEQKQKILRTRARQLAKKEEDQFNQNQKDVLELMKFLIGTEIYAIEAKYILEIVLFRECTSLPTVPSFIEGVINVRRRIVAVINLANFFELPVQKEEKESQKIGIILQKEEEEFAILSTNVLGIVKISREEIQPTLPALTALQQDFIRGVTKQRIVILDGHKLLTDSRLKLDEPF